MSYSKLLKWVYLSALCWWAVLAAVTVTAQVAGTADVTLNYTLPIKNTDNSDIPATGLNSLSKVRIYLSNSAIPADVSGLTPTLETPPGTTATVSAFSTSLGATIHARITVCNVAGACSAATNESTAVVTAKVPGSPTFNTLIITVK